jgi:hypothetical protein
MVELEKSKSEGLIESSCLEKDRKPSSNKLLIISSHRLQILRLGHGGGDENPHRSYRRWKL